MKITNEIFQVGGGTFTSPENATIYLINFNGQAACEGHFGIYKGKKKVRNFIKQFLK